MRFVGVEPLPKFGVKSDGSCSDPSCGWLMKGSGRVLPWAQARRGVVKGSGDGQT